MDLKLTSEVFDPDGMIPAQYTCEGDDMSPPLNWQGVPDEAQSLVMICDDPDAPNGTWTHWLLYNVPLSRQSLPEGVPTDPELPWGGMQGRNDSGALGYGGPCPPPGPAHHYYFRLYALDEAPDLSPGATRQQVLDAIQDHILEKTELIGRYARS